MVITATTMIILSINFMILTWIVIIIIIIIIIIIHLQALCPHGSQDGTCGGVQVIMILLLLMK